ncbi:MAG: hypothetical protein QNJ45_24965 [Ardenticatenaceae bacterium]|nr:hypothetical protein [Ardenticatenaceae bacterium]
MATDSDTVFTQSASNFGGWPGGGSMGYDAAAGLARFFNHVD